MVAPDGCPQPVGRSLVGRRGEHRASDPAGGRLAHPRPDPGVAPSVATAIASPSTFLLVLAYDGTNYRGWQIQPDSRTVQGVLRDAARRLAPDARVAGAGPTDARRPAPRPALSPSPSRRRAPPAFPPAPP